MTRLKIAAITLATTPLYLALAVWGEGGVGQALAKPAVVAAIVVTVAAAIVGLFSEGNISTGEREDRGNRWVLAVLGVLGLLGGFVPAWCDGHGLWPVDGEAVRWAGVVIYVAGLVLRLAPVFVLGRRFSGLVAIQPGHALVTGGLYGLVRNPSYLGLMVMALGWALVFDAWAGVALALLQLPPLIARMDSEENMLQSQFGEAYRAYRARTWRLLPWVY